MILRRYFAKMRGAGRAPGRPPFETIAWSGAGGLAAIAAVAGITLASDYPLLMAPFGASAVLLFGMHDLPASQPRNVIGGHLLAALLGLILLTLLGDAWWVMAIGVGGAIALMQLSRTLPPPAGANPIVIALSAADWSFLLAPVLLGALAMVLEALVFNNIPRARKYPSYWW